MGASNPPEMVALVLTHSHMPLQHALGLLNEKQGKLINHDLGLQKPILKLEFRGSR